MIVLTGASGVIGRAFIAHLRAMCIPYIALDRDALTQSTSIVSMVSKEPSVLVHLAAVVPQPPGIPDDNICASLTRKIDARVLEAARQWNCHAVYASGCSLYAKNSTVPKREEDAGKELKPSSPYLAAKQKGESDFLNSGRATVLRISAPVGDGLPVATVLGRFIETARTAGNLEVWGSGRREQNYVDVVDLADALHRVLVTRPRELINVSADHPVTMLKLAQEVALVYGQGTVLMTGKPDPRESETARYSNQRAYELLGWRPTTSLRSSLERLRGSPS